MRQPLPRPNFLSALGLLVLLAACHKDKPAPAPPGSWQVDGQLQQSEKVMVEVGTPTYNANTVTISIWQSFNTTTSTGSAVVLTMQVPQGTGTYSLAGTSAKASAAYSAYSSAGQGVGLYPAISGSITISTLTGSAIAGTFAFTGAELFNAQQTKQITNGQFATSF